MHETHITPDGLRRLTEELERLRTDGRAAVAERIQAAKASESNANESFDYLDAREEQALLERRIAQLEERLRFAVVAEPDASNGVVDLGETVRLRAVETGDEVAYRLVGQLEAGPSQGRVSIASPLGRALLGRGPGDVVVVDAPRGRLVYEILEIRDDAAAGAEAQTRPAPSAARHTNGVGSRPVAAR